MKAGEAFKVAKSTVLLSGDVAAREMYFLGAYLPFRSWSLTYIDGSYGQCYPRYPSWRAHRHFAYSERRLGGAEEEEFS